MRAGYRLARARVRAYSRAVAPISLVIALALSGQDAPPADPLAAARAALAASEPGCEKAALDALQTGALDEKQTAAAWSLRAQCYLLVNDADRAERSFAAALRIDPALAPIEHEAFARAQKTAPAGALVVGAAATDAGTVEVTLSADDLGLAKGAVLLDAGEEVARMPLELGMARHRVSGLDRTDGLEARALDRYGNTIVRVAVAPAPMAAPLTAAAEPERTAANGALPTVLTYVGAGLLGAGALGMTAASVGLGMSGTHAPLEDAPLLVAGLAGSGAAFAVGAGLVVVDQGLDK
jgi:hypothetical protein